MDQLGQEGGKEVDAVRAVFSGSPLPALMHGDSLSRDEPKPFHDLQPFLPAGRK